MTDSLKIEKLSVKVEEKNILHDFDLEINPGEVHCIMGPNGSGKSTLVNTIMGHSAYSIESGFVSLGDQDVLKMSVSERSLAGLFLAFQYPKEIAGVSMLDFLRSVYNAHLLQRDSEAKPMKLFRFKRFILPFLEELKISPEFLGRFVNQGFSGGEKKKAEILQMKLIQPKFALLDETDSGLDVDALKIVAEGVESMRDGKLGVLIVTHYRRILEYIKPDFVHVMKNGRLVKSGGHDFAEELERDGYEKY